MCVEFNCESIHSALFPPWGTRCGMSRVWRAADKLLLITSLQVVALIKKYLFPTPTQLSLGHASPNNLRQCRCQLGIEKHGLWNQGNDSSVGKVVALQEWILRTYVKTRYRTASLEPRPSYGRGEVREGDSPGSLAHTVASMRFYLKRGARWRSVPRVVLWSPQMHHGTKAPTISTPTHARTYIKTSFLVHSLLPLILTLR